MGKHYSATFADLEKKLARVMERLGVEKYDFDWHRSRSGCECYVEMMYCGRAYRFENSTEKSRESGRGLIYDSDLFAAIVYALEGLARSVEQGIFTLDMLLTGALALPEASTLEPCFAALGFSERPTDAETVKAQYRRMVKVMHPDAGGDATAFEGLKQNYEACLAAM